MKTLYELLGALPDDDAESLRAAFRKTAKANHPDNNPGDPDAPRRFRRIVRAKAILSDERQRATYDQLLEIARKQQRRSKPGRGVFSDAIRELATGALAVIILSAVFIEAYLLSGYALLVPARVIGVEVSAREPAPSAAVISTPLSDKIDRTGPPDKRDDVGAVEKREDAGDLKEVAATGSIAPITGSIAPMESAGSAPASAKLPPARDFGVNDARHYREQGILAYRSGDFYLALVDFDLAIDLDPNFSDAYIDRGIVLHRIGDLQRAFADVARAKRIDDANRSKPPATASHQASDSQGNN